MQGFAAKYSSLLEEMINAKELLSQVNTFLMGKVSAAEAPGTSVEETLRRIETLAPVTVKEGSDLKQLYQYPQREVTEGFALEVERVAKILKASLGNKRPM